jgi:hypothetical protein
VLDLLQAVPDDLDQVGEAGHGACRINPDSHLSIMRCDTDRRQGGRNCDGQTRSRLPAWQ